MAYSDEAVAILADLSESDNLSRLTKRSAESGRRILERTQKLYDQDRITLNLQSQAIALKSRTEAAHRLGDHAALINALAAERNARLKIWRRIAALYHAHRRGGETEKYYVSAAEFAASHAKLLLAVQGHEANYRAIVHLPDGELPPGFDGSTSARSFRSALTALQSLPKPDYLNNRVHLERRLKVINDEEVYARAYRDEIWAELAPLYSPANDFNLKQLSLVTSKNTNDAYAYYYLAAAHLAADDAKAYSNVCHEMLWRFDQTSDPYSCQRLVYACVAAPNAVEDPNLVVTYALRLRADWTDSHRLLGAAHYRAGQFQHALERFDKSTQSGFQPRAWDFAFIAMIHHRLGRKSEASEALEQAQQKKADIEAWWEKAEVDHLIREAEGMISIKPSVP
jgi:hypothetical protein